MVTGIFSEDSSAARTFAMVFVIFPDVSSLARTSARSNYCAMVAGIFSEIKSLTHTFAIMVSALKALATVQG